MLSKCDLAEGLTGATWVVVGCLRATWAFPFSFVPLCLAHTGIQRKEQFKKAQKSSQGHTGAPGPGLEVSTGPSDLQNLDSEVSQQKQAAWYAFPKGATAQDVPHISCAKTKPTLSWTLEKLLVTLWSI